MTPGLASNSAGPIVDNERADVLDALRGFALLGIFISHVPDFSGHTFMTAIEQAALDRFHLDGAAAMLQDFLIRGKFYSLFSLLFGIGFAVQLESAARRGADFVRHFARRLTVLLVIGLIHACLWYGDILKDYALIGFVLILLRRSSAKTIALVAASVFAMRVVWPVVVSVLVPMISPVSSSPGGSFFALTRAFDSADPSAIFLANLGLLQLKALQMIYDGKAISILAMFLLGALIGKSGFYRNVSAHRRLFRNVFWLCAPIGVIGNAALTPIHAVTPDFPPTGMWVIESSLYAIAVPAMAIAYASGFAWLWSCGWRSILRWFAPAGRMALTTYVSQTLIGIALFYGVGLGFRGRIGLVEGTILAIGIFATQCASASLWLRSFRFGPIEWFWRRMTYGVPITLYRDTPPRLSSAGA